MLKSNGDAETASGWDTKTTALSGGQSYDAQTDGGAAGRYMSTQTITLTSTTLQFRGWDAPGAYASIGAARLTIVPETETYALLAGVCGLTFVILRRRR